MASIELTENECQALMNILATTREHPWTVTNPLLMKIGQHLQRQGPVQQMSEAAYDRIKRDGKEVGHE